MSEYAFHPHGHNALTGPARNPWGLARMAGGSSGGSAAALAARLVFGSMGSDAGGSIRHPSALCGVVGLLPTRGRVSRHGMMPSSPSLDSAGPIARTVRDCATLFGVGAGHDPADPTTAERSFALSRSVWTRLLRRQRIAVLKDPLLETMTPAVRGVFDATVDVFRQEGVEIEAIDLADWTRSMPSPPLSSRQKWRRRSERGLPPIPTPIRQRCTSAWRLASFIPLPIISMRYACARG